MRVTSGMISRIERKLGVTGRRSSLLDYVNGGSRNKTSFLNTIRAGYAEAEKKANKVKYEKLEKSADEVNKHVAKLSEDGDDGMFAKAESSGKTGEVVNEVEYAVKSFNELIATMREDGSALNSFYMRNLNDVIKENADMLEEIGITTGRSGKLEIDRERLRAADLETLKKTVGPESDFADKLSFLSARIEDNARTSLESLSYRYTVGGGSTSVYKSRYDAKG